jgi:hypothetical protein
MVQEANIHWDILDILRRVVDTDVGFEESQIHDVLDRKYGANDVTYGFAVLQNNTIL